MSDERGGGDVRRAGGVKLTVRRNESVSTGVMI